MRDQTMVATEPENPTIHRLAANAHISVADASVALNLITKLRNIHLTARSFVDIHGLRPEIFLPGNHWADLTNPDAYFAWTQNRIDFVRLISPFSGFDMCVWARQGHAPGDDQTKI